MRSHKHQARICLSVFIINISVESENEQRSSYSYPHLEGIRLVSVTPILCKSLEKILHCRIIHTRIRPSLK